MGRVDLAVTRLPSGLARVAVIKRMLPEIRTPDQERRWRREANIALHLSHGAIAHTLDVEVIEGDLCLLQEYVFGVNAAQLQRRAAGEAPLPVSISIPILREVARALDYAHAQGVVHRDVAEDNVMLSYDGQVRLVDFGIAKPLGGDQTSLTEVGVVVGRPIYTAPEILNGAPASPASDVYSLGVVAWKLLTGRSFPDPPPASGVAPSQFNPSVPLNVDRLVIAATASDPVERPTAAEMLGTLAVGSERQLAEFLGLHFRVEAERRQLDADIDRALVQLEELSSATAVASAAETTQAVEAAAPAAALEHTDAGDADPRSRRRAGGAVAIVALIAGLAGGFAGDRFYLGRYAPVAPPPIVAEGLPPTVAPVVPRSAPTAAVVAPPPAVEPQHAIAAPPPEVTDLAAPPAAATAAPPPSPSPGKRRMAASPARSRGRPAVPVMPAPSLTAVPTPAPAPTPPPDVDEIVRAARSKFALGEMPAAEALAQRAVALGASAAGHLLIGKIRFREHRYVEAETELLEALRAQPDNPDAGRYLDQARRALQKSDGRELPGTNPGDRPTTRSE